MHERHWKEKDLPDTFDFLASFSRLVTMPHHCCVPECSSDGVKKAADAKGRSISFFSFPSDPIVHKEWIVQIRRDAGEHFSINKHTKVCSLHFAEDAFYPGDHKRDPSQKATAQTRLKLLPGAVPTIFSWSKASVKRKAPAERRPLPEKRPRYRVQSTTLEEKDASMNVSFGACLDDTAHGGSEDDGGAERHSARTHAHCRCVETLEHEIAVLETENDKLQSECEELREEIDRLKDVESKLAAHVFSVERFKGDDKLITFYTGFTSYVMFLACFNFLRRSAEVMRSWRSSRTTPDDWDQLGEKPGPKPKLALVEQFFLVMVRLRLGLYEVDLSDRFKIHPSTVSRIVLTWLNLMYQKFQQLPIWLSRRKINKLMPPCFRKWYPTTRIVIDCTEFYINTPSSLARQSATWSEYKSHNTVKCLIGIAPHGHITLVSSVFEGAISDRAITEESGLLNMLERGDSVMADKGFDIQDLLITHGVKLNIPPFKRKDEQMCPEDLATTKKIAAVRIHVERKMQRIKCFRIIGREIENSMFDSLEQLIFVCSMLTNFQSALVA